MNVSSDISQLLHDTATGDWIMIAPRRAHRSDGERRHGADPFAPSALRQREKIIARYGLGRDRITVIENMFPLFVRGAGVSGYQELLVEGTRIRSFASFSVAQIEQVLRAYALRAYAVRKMRGMKSLFIFKNEGRDAGASQRHPHSQLFALSFVPRRARRKKQIPTPIDPRHRIWSDRWAILCVHQAARFSYEVRILTRRNIDNLTQANPSEIRSCAKALHLCLRFVKKKRLAFNFFFHDVFGDTHEQFEIRFVPRGLNLWGGFELDTGVVVNPVSAEQAAKEYRAAARFKSPT